MESIYLVENDFNGMTWTHKRFEGAKRRVKDELSTLREIDDSTKVLRINEYDYDCNLIFIKFRDRSGFITIREAQLFD